MRAHVCLVLWLSVVVAAAAAPVRGFVGVSDFPYTVQHADVIVRAKMIRWDEIPLPEGSAEGLSPKKEGRRAMARVQRLEVRKVLAGQCPDRIFVTPFYGHPDSLDLEPDQECYLFLRWSQRLPGAYEAMNLGLTAIPVEDGRVVLPKHVHYRGAEGAERLLKAESVETAEKVEAALRYFRGPDLEVRPLKDAFACDEPLALEVTLTNTTSRPMVLALDRGRALRRHFSLGLTDGQGCSVLVNPTLTMREDMMEDSAFEHLRETVRLGMGESLRRTLRFPLPPAQFALSPQRAQTATLVYHSGRRPGAWWGCQFGWCPVRLRGADRTWTDTLARPTDGLTVTLRVAGGWRPARSTVGTRRDVWMDVMLARLAPKPLSRSRMTGGYGYSTPQVSRAEWAALAAHLEVRLGDRVLTHPKPAPGGLGALLERVRPGKRVRVEHWNLAEAVDFSEPGLYRVRLVVPDGEASARSNEVLVRILQADGDAGKEAP